MIDGVALILIDVCGGRRVGLMSLLCGAPELSEFMLFGDAVTSVTSCRLHDYVHAPLKLEWNHLRSAVAVYVLGIPRIGRHCHGRGDGSLAG